jgi:hypothetical protein
MELEKYVSYLFIFLFRPREIWGRKRKLHAVLPESNGETSDSEKDDSNLSDIDLHAPPKKSKAVSIYYYIV